jgi:glycosyltransferase involved in cell wall biosynthesis
LVGDIIKICFLSNGHEHGIFTHLWIDYFIKKHEISLITYHKPLEFDYNIDVHYFPAKNKIQFLKFVIKAKKTIKKINPEVLYALNLTNYGLAGAFSGFRPFFLSPLGSDIAMLPDKSKFYSYLTKYVLKKVDIIQVQDPLSAKRVSLLGVSTSKIKMIPWGADVELFKPRNFKKKYDVINLHGNSYDSHDVPTFIKSLKYVKKEFPDVKYLILGNKYPSFNLAEKIGVNDNITYGGFITHNKLPTFISQSNIFVDCFHPNHNFGGHTYGMALLEAMACGTPTVVANRPTISQLKGVDKWYFGLTFKGGDPKDLSLKIIDLLNSKEKQKQISLKNRKIVEERFNWGHNVTQLEKMILANYNSFS